MTTMHDVAAHAKVSAKTVSRVFNDDPHVAPATRERILAAMKQLNYVPNTLAQNFRTGRAPVIGVAVPDIADPFFSSIARAVEEIAAEQNMSVSVTSLGNDPSREEPVLESLLRFQLSGLIVAPISENQAYLSRWTDHTPVVFVDRAPTKLAVDSFVEDDLGGAHAATTHLIRHGHTRIAFIGDTLSIPTTANRLEGYKSALADAGLPYRDDLVVFGARTVEGARQAVATLIGRQLEPTAVFSSDARCSMSLIPALQEAHQSNLALVGFGDFPMANALRPAITVVDQDPANLGRLAITRILDRIANPTKRYRRRTILPVGLVERASCLVPWDSPVTEPANGDLASDDDTFSPLQAAS
ncbi:LacI family DNA-binding transcriptional regulator [Subtercola sp. YIM 133946]|uniref:LacI family DNA-binding transcriptional regulator n=1 Tax=Subtercola sp. YIM 133946 TaxID=3118909 RepID=UPI002F921585